MIRALTAGELGRVEDAAREFYASSRVLGEFSLERFREIWGELLKTPAAVIFADVRSDGLAGVIGGLAHREIYSDRMIAEEFFWFVREAQRGSGIALYRAFERWARERGAAEIHMAHLFDSMPDKVAKFYLRAGFEPVEMRYKKSLTAGRAAAA